MAVLAVAGTALVSGCDDGNTGLGPDPSDTLSAPDTVDSVALDPASVTLPVGAAVVIRRLGVDEGRPSLNPPAGPYAWTSSDEAVAAVAGMEKRGSVHARSVGTATITSGGPDDVGTSLVDVVEPPRFVSVAAGASGWCAVDEGGTPWCWGSGRELVGGGPARPGFFAGLESVSIAYRVGCGLSSSGTASCWGIDILDELGNGPGSPAWCGFGCALEPVTVVGAPPLVSLSTFRHGACGLTADGSAYCWGRGIGESAVPVPGGGTWTWVGGSNYAICFLDEERRLHCGAPGAEPVLVDPDLRFTTMDSGYEHACGLDDDGRAWCVGENRYGQLGTGRIQPGGGLARFFTVQTPLGDHRWIDVTASASSDGNDPFTCGVDNERMLWCWGSNRWGQLGQGHALPIHGNGCGNLTCANEPIPVAPAMRWRSVSAGASAACGIAVDGLLYCWGWGTAGFSPTCVDDECHTPHVMAGQRGAELEPA